MVKVKPILNPAHGEVTAFTQEAVQILDQTLLDNRTVAITYVSVLIHRKFPQLPRESRRAIAARHLQGERKRREKNSKSK